MQPNIIETKLQLLNPKECPQQGHNSRTYIAFDPQLGTDVFVKVINKTNFSTEDNYFEEAKILYTSKHPHIAEIRCGTQDNDYIYFIMDYYPKGSLAHISQTQNLTCRQVIKYAIDILAGIQYIHTKQLVHFDVKPSNILLTNNNNAILTDFGLSKYMSNGFASPDQMYSSHIPPESFIAKELTVQSDIYQLGVTLYRLLNTRSIWDNFVSTIINMKDDEFISKISTGKLPDRRLYLPHIPLKLRRIVNKAMNVEPNKRYKTALDLHNALSGNILSIDWTYNNDGGKYVWIQQSNGRKTVFELVNNNSQMWQELNGNKRKISKGCRNNIPPREVQAFCESILLE